MNAYICTDDFDSVVTSNICRLQHEHLSDDEIESIMGETFEARKAWICSKLPPPVRTIFAKFPPLKDVLSSYVIIDDFVDDAFLHLYMSAVRFHALKVNGNHKIVDGAKMIDCTIRGATAVLKLGDHIDYNDEKFPKSFPKHR
jgi:hypothetical protein